MTYLVVLIGVIFISYLVHVYIRFGILPSISASYYALRRDGNKWLFIIFMYYLAVSLLLVASLNPHPMAWTFFVAGSAAAFVGIAARYREKLDERIHVGAAYSLIIFNLLGIGLVFSNFWPAYFFIVLGLVGAIFQNKIKNFGYWTEVLAFVCIIWGVFQR